jgi:hypothetical protein
MSLTTADRITSLWPQTEELLIAADLDVPYEDAKNQATVDVLAELWRVYAPVGSSVPTDPDALPGAVQQQIAEMAVLTLIRGAQDWYGQDPLKQGPEGGDVTLQDNVKRLDNLATALGVSIAARETAVAAAIRDLTGATTVRVGPPTVFALASGGRGRW